MSDKTIRKELTVRLDSDLYEQLRDATYKLRISKQQAMIGALKLWFRSNSAIDVPHSSTPDKHIPADMLPVVDWLVHLWAHKGTLEEESLINSLKAIAARRRTVRRVRTKKAS
uniref:Uncharacterized protein n=1 Tax=Solibacter usitatus (strain Ellin6076) TaxID=234267 RepID=Q01RG7_SOLUE